VSVAEAEAPQRPQQTSPLEYIANIAGLIFVLTAVVTYAVRNLGNRNFWSDEASSLYSSLGWPEVGEKSRGLSEAWAASQSHIEPGLFNMLEFFWANAIGTQITTIRLMPFLFFIAYLASLLALSRFVKAPWYLGFAVIGLMLLENITPYYAVELRPHIAGLAAAVVLPLLAIWFTRKTTALRFFLFILGFMFFGSMQYPTYAIAAAIAVVLLLAALHAKIKAARFMLIGASAFSVLWLPTTFVIVRGSPFGLAGGGAIHAIPEAFFPNLPLSEVMSIVGTNMLSPTGLPRTIFIVLVPMLWILGRFPKPNRGMHPAQWAIQSLWITVTISTAISFVLAMLGFMPWILGTRWSIADVGLIGLSLIGLIGLIANSGLLQRKFIHFAAIGIAIIVTLAGSIRLATYERTPGYDWNQALEIMLSGEPGKTIIDNWTYPELRYWVELSGDYDQYRVQWINHSVRESPYFGDISKSEVESLLTSGNDRVVLRSSELIKGLDIFDTHSVIEVQTWAGEDIESRPSPIIIVRN
jgi:hypothetical protein